MLVLTLASVVTTAAVLVSVLGSILVAQRRAGSAADLAALAGAVAAQRGQDACAAAGRLAERNGVQLRACTVGSADVRLEVSLSVGGLLGRAATVRARARAGSVGPAQLVGP